MLSTTTFRWCPKCKRRGRRLLRLGLAFRKYLTTTTPVFRALVDDDDASPVPSFNVKLELRVVRRSAAQTFTELSESSAPGAVIAVGLDAALLDTEGLHLSGAAAGPLRRRHGDGLRRLEPAVRDRLRLRGPCLARRSSRACPPSGRRTVAATGCSHMAAGHPDLPARHRRRARSPATATASARRRPPRRTRPPCGPVPTAAPVPW